MYGVGHMGVVGGTRGGRWGGEVGEWGMGRNIDTTRSVPQVLIAYRKKNYGRNIYAFSWVYIDLPFLVFT